MIPRKARLGDNARTGRNLVVFGLVHRTSDRVFRFRRRTISQFHHRGQ